MSRFPAALLLCLPLAASAFDWNGNFGLYYTRTDAWYPYADRLTVPSLTLDLGLGVRGYIPEPGMLELSARADYRWFTSDTADSPSVNSRQLTYRLGAALFHNATSPLRLNLLASQERREFKTGSSASGDGITNAYGGGLSLRFPAQTSVDGTYQHDRLEENFATLPAHDRDRDLVTAAFRNDVGPFSLRATFMGEWSKGSWLQDNFDQQFVNVQARARIAGDWNLNVSDGYSRRQPTATGYGAYAFETNGFRAGVERSIDELSRAVYYDHIRSTSTSWSSTSRGEAQSLRALYDVPIDGSRLYVRTTGSVAYTDVASPSLSAETTGETLGLDLWRRAAARQGFDLHGGPTVAAIQSSVGGDGVGYGLVAGARYGHDFDPTTFQGTIRPGTVQASYELGYGSDVDAKLGWSIQQTLQGVLSGILRSSRWSLAGTGSFARASSPVFGDSASRSLGVNGTLTFHEVAFSAGVAIADGAPAGGHFSGDGLLVQAPYQSHSRSVNLGVSSGLWFGLSGQAYVAYSTNDAPGSPAMDLFESTGSLTYSYGGLNFLLRDRVTSTETTVGRALVNLVELRVSRALGSYR